MSAENKITLKIQADIHDLNIKLDAVLDKLKVFEHQVKNTDTATQQLNTGLKAFSWVAFGQGALNTTTAISQLITATSSLERVNYQVNQSALSVQKARINWQERLYN